MRPAPFLESRPLKFALPETLFVEFQSVQVKSVPPFLCRQPRFLLCLASVVIPETWDVLPDAS